MGLALVPLLLASAIGSCVIAEPSIDLPSLPEQRPIILRDEVVPPVNVVLGYLPDYFELAVQADPAATIEARLFIDYDALSSNSAEATFAGKVRLTPSVGADAGVRELSLFHDQLPVEPSHNECHIIEAIVAYGFVGIAPGGGLAAHTPDPRGGDSVVWFYSPSGDLSSCPHVDGGLGDGAPPDASAADGPAPLTPDGGAE